MKKSSSNFKYVFNEIVANLKISEYKSLSAPLNDNEGPISNIIEKYKNHPRIIGIKNIFPSHSFVIETVRKYTNQKS